MGDERSTGNKASDLAGTLRSFRKRLHRCFSRRTDALFELCDAILTAGAVPPPVHLSLAAVARASSIRSFDVTTPWLLSGVKVVSTRVRRTAPLVSAL